MSWIEEVKEILRERLRANKIKLIEPRGLEDCYLLIVEAGDNVFLIGLWNSKRAFYAKITPATSIPAKWDCRSLKYTPIGLYAFAKDIRELAYRVAEKFPVIINISKNANIMVA